MAVMVASALMLTACGGVYQTSDFSKYVKAGQV